MRMQAVHEVSRRMSLNKALRYCGMSKRAWYYVKKPRDVAIDANVADRVRGIASRRPTYGTRRMAAQVARETSSWKCTTRQIPDSENTARKVLTPL